MSLQIRVCLPLDLRQLTDAFDKQLLEALVLNADALVDELGAIAAATGRLCLLAPPAQVLRRLLALEVERSGHVLVVRDLFEVRLRVSGEELGAQHSHFLAHGDGVRVRRLGL